MKKTKLVIQFKENSDKIQYELHIFVTITKISANSYREMNAYIAGSLALPAGNAGNSSSQYIGLHTYFEFVVRAVVCSLNIGANMKSYFSYSLLFPL